MTKTRIFLHSYCGPNPGLHILLQAAVFMLAIFWEGCTTSASGPSSGGQISMIAKYAGGSVIPFTKAQPFSTAPAAVDSIRISRARFVVRRIEFKMQSDSVEFHSIARVLDLDLSGAVQNVSVVDVPFGRYDEVEFEVHRVDTVEVNILPPADRTQFQDFLAGNRSSIIVEGTVYASGQSPQPFTFRSRVDASQTLPLTTPVIVDESSPVVNTTMHVSSANWFRGASGLLLDPNDPGNENNISDNLRISVRIFKDNNRDGSEDSN